MLNHCATVTIILLSTLLIVSTQSTDDAADVKLLSYKNSPPTRDGYNFMYETSDGSIREEMGIIMNPGTPEEELVVVGRYSYKSGDDVLTVMYMADKNGYRPKTMLRSKTMPKPPMLKKDVFKSLNG